MRRRGRATRRRGFFTFAAALGLAAPMRAQVAHAAQNPGVVRLHWSAPPGCATASEIEASVADLLGRRVETSDGRDWVVRASASANRNGRWNGTVETQVGPKEGKRTFEAESCRAVADATALIVALMIDPERVSARRPTPPATTASATTPATTASAPAAPAGSTPAPAASTPAPALAPAPAISTPAPAASTSAPAPDSSAAPPSSEDDGDRSALRRASRPLSLRFLLGPMVAADVGTLPEPTYGAGAKLGVLLGRSSIEAGAIVWARQSGTVDGSAGGAGGRFDLISGYLAGCPALPAGRFDIGACVEAELGTLKAVGTGVTDSYPNESRWVALGGGGLARLRLGEKIAIALQLDALAPLTRPTFILRGIAESGGKVHQPAPVIGRASISADASF